MSQSSASRTKRAILDLIKQQGPRTADELATELGISAMAVRQHLYQLQEEKLITFREESRGIGRPAKLWELTKKTVTLFPDSHAELTVNLLKSIKETFGAEGMSSLLQHRAEKQIQAYLALMPKRASLQRRVEKLAEIRAQEGYMAEVIARKPHSFLLVENHCPICVAATACTGLCGMELEVFQAVLGDKVKISRTEHIIEGDRRCAYLISPAS